MSNHKSLRFDEIAGIKGLATLVILIFYTSKFSKYFFDKFSSFFEEVLLPFYLVLSQVLISLTSWLVIQDFAINGL
jgi:hypothetical protein